MTESATFRDLQGLATALKVCLTGYIAIAVIALWSGGLQIVLLTAAAHGSGFTEAEGAANDARQQTVRIVQFVVFLITVIVWSRWTYFSSRNARALGAQGLRFTPGWAVGWYFIPVATFWKPYQALKETFQASHSAASNWSQAPRPAIMPIWWTLWVLANIAGQVVFRLSWAAETLEQHIAGSWLTFATDALDLPLGIVAIMLVSTLNAWQTEKSRSGAPDITEPSPHI